MDFFIIFGGENENAKKCSFGAVKGRAHTRDSQLAPLCLEFGLPPVESLLLFGESKLSEQFEPELSFGGK